MSLPPALQARLAKRGLLKQNRTDSQNDQLQEEEIIAENYDDPSEQLQQNPTNLKLEEIINCPNLSNPYHECTLYCKKRYGLKAFKPNPIMERRRNRMLKIYPLPLGWKEVPDIHTNRYYYWNVETDEVCWLSPSHPKAEITVSTNAPKRNETSKSSDNVKKAKFSDDEENEDDNNEEDNESDDDDDDDDDDESDDENENHKKSKNNASDDLDEYLSSYQRDKNKRFNANQRKVKGSDPLDPMDPAAYSDIPRGKWSQGLNVKGRTAADETASGPLFQMRPYPSPGQILRMNAESNKK